MSALYGLLAIRKYSLDHSATPLADMIAALKRLSPDNAYHDYKTAVRLNELLPDANHADIPAFFRNILNVAISSAHPWWARLASFGRERVRAALTENEEQCFDAAGLFSPAPNADILSWWDTLAQAARAIENETQLLQGREAERLTIKYETERLLRLGITLQPRWIALDDNCAGYDVHSFNAGPIDPVAKLIEVKSSARDTCEIFLTQNEWQTALEREPNYRFQIWILPDQELIELAPSDLKGHVPVNQGNGLWEIVRIRLSLPMEKPSE